MIRDCQACESGWRRRQVPHPSIKDRMVTVSRVCKFCKGTGKVRDDKPDPKQLAANNR